MRKIKYHLVVSDFDGTLVKKDTTIGEFCKQAIAEYIKNGGNFALSSGRMPSSIRRRAQELGLKGIVCAYQGSVIMDIESGKVFSEGKLDYDLAFDACKYFEEKGFSLVLSQSDATPEVLVKKLKELHASSPKLKEAMQNSGIDNGTDNVIRVIYSVLEQKA